MLREAGYYSRMALGWYQLARMPLEPNPPALVRKYLENRETHFLELMREAVFACPTSPYYSLFQWAGCSYRDLEEAVLSDGLEATLESLRKAGVYLSHDEFKGKKPVERSGKTIALDPGDLANPLVQGTLETSSSGSRSSGTVTRRSLEYQFYREAQERVFVDEFDISRRTLIRLSSILPSTGGLRRGLLYPRRGNPVDKWFALAGSFRDSWHYRAFTKFLVLEARMLGIKTEFPTYLPTNDFSQVALHLARRRSEGANCLFSASVSLAVRVAAAAAEGGLDISGILFSVNGEALTDAKREVIEATGAKPYPGYTISELGKIGGPCRQMDRGNCVHVCLDSVALISYRRLAPLTEVEIDSLMFTSLLPCAATVLVNVEMDDSGVLEPASCDCSLTKLGFTRQVSNIYSYGKLTGQGMCLVGSDVLGILERALPGRFGGTPTDYQLVEQEGNQQTEIELRVHPRLGALSEEEVKSFFLSELVKVYGGSLSRRTWLQTDGIKVRLAEPYMSGGRKVHPLHLLGTTERQRSSSPGPDTR